MLSHLTFGAFTAYQTFSSLAEDHLGRTKRFFDELALFTQPGTLSVLKSEATNTRQEWFLILVLKQITVIEIPASHGLLQLGVFHLFYLVCKFETKNAGCKQKQEDLRIFIVVHILEIGGIGGAINVRCLLLSTLSSARLVLRGVSTGPLPGSTWIMQVWEITNQNGCFPQ